MKVLIACIPTPGNRFLTDLIEGLRKHVTVVHDFKKFWECRDNFDIVHIHWPEYLSYETESYLYNELNFKQELWNSLKNCLKYWSNNAEIIVTRHNTLPHNRQDDNFKNLYKLVFTYANIITHFANYSIREYHNMYPDLKKAKHIVIPHHNYASLNNFSYYKQARVKLNITSDTTVMLVFGNIRESEKKLINKAFKYIPNQKKLLLAPGWKINRRKISYIRAREWVWKLEQWLIKFNKKKKINLGFIKEDMVHLYLNAADFLFLPRINQLNSGNLPLGFTFGKVVVGSNLGNYGEILKETGNPIFEVGDDSSLQKAILKALLLKDDKFGEKNRKIASNKWNTSKIADLYYHEFVNLLD